MTSLTKIFPQLSLNYLNCGKIKFNALNFMLGFTVYQQFFLDITIIIPQSLFYHNSSGVKFHNHGRFPEGETEYLRNLRGFDWMLQKSCPQKKALTTSLVPLNLIRRV